MKTGLFNPTGHSRVGPGGWFCVCCGPAPKQRKKMARLHKKRIYAMLDKWDKRNV